MKNIIALLAAFVFASGLHATTLKEGLHYEVIAETSTSKPEIKEFFSYYCPHCLAFEPLADRFVENADKNGIEFKKSHVDFVRAAGPDIQAMLAKALVTSEKLNKPAASKAIFNHIHRNRGVFTSEKDIKDLFIANGVTSAEFDKAFNSFAVKAAAKNMKKVQEKMTRARVVTSVPTFIVNGKYKIISTAFKARTYQELFDQLEKAAIELANRKDTK